MFVDSLLLFGGLAALGAVLFVVTNPPFARRAVPFGVRVPPDRVAAPEVLRQWRTFRIRVVLTTVVVAVAAVPLSWVSPRPVVEIGSGILLIALVAAFSIQARNVLSRLKRTEGWYDGLRQGAAADTSLRTDPVKYPWVWAVPALSVLAASIVLAFVKYPSLPELLYYPERTPSGTEFTGVGKSFFSAFGLVLLQIVQTAVVLGGVAGTLRARGDLDVSRPTGSARAYRRYLTLMARGTLLLGALMNVALLALSWLVWAGNRSTVAVLVALGAPALIAMGIIGFLAMRAGPGGSELPENDAPDEQQRGLVPRDDDKFWRGDMWYSNPEDPAILVSRRVGMGWTLNTGNPVSRVILVTLAVAVIAFVLLGVITPQWR